MTAEKRTRLYLTAAHLGAVGAIIIVAAQILDFRDFIKGLGIGMTVAPLAVLLVRRLRDEYIDSLWRAGTSWAFVAVVVSFLFAPFIQRFVDGLLGSARYQEWPVEAAGLIAILAFFTGFYLKWLRSRL